MAQFRYHNYQRPVASFDENLRLAGITFPGRICGWDVMSVVSGNTLQVAHTLTGVSPTNTDGSAGNKRGCTQSRQGILVYEDAPIQVNVDYNGGNSNDRIDILIMTHSYIASSGGATANYSIIKGSLSGATEPPLTNTLIQSAIGKFRIKANATDHTQTAWEPFEVTVQGGIHAFYKDDEVQVKDASNILSPGKTETGAVTLSDFNRVLKSGLYFVTSTTNRPTTATDKWFIIVMTRGVYTVQLAQDIVTGKAYVRSCSDTGVTWTPWGDLNNADITTDISALQTAVGNLVYSGTPFVVTNGHNLTSTIGDLDTGLRSIFNSLASTITQVNTNTTAIAAINTALANYAPLNDPNTFANLSLTSPFTSSGSNVAQWRINQFGQVQFRGTISNATALTGGPSDFLFWNVATLPTAIANAINSSSYRTTKTLVIPCTANIGRGLSSLVAVPASLILNNVGGTNVITLSVGKFTDLAGNGFPSHTDYQISFSFDGINAQI